MTIVQLKYAIAVAEHRNFTVAADKCFVTQPTLSMQIQKLEAELDITIFDRTGRLVRTYKLEYSKEGYTRSIEINDLESGVYTIRLIQGELEMTNKLIIVK